MQRCVCHLPQSMLCIHHTGGYTGVNRNGSGHRRVTGVLLEVLLIEGTMVRNCWAHRACSRSLWSRCTHYIGVAEVIPNEEQRLV